MIFPHPLRRGDKIAIISPASIVKDEYIDGATEFLMRNGLDPVVLPFARGPHSGSYASSENQRLSDLKEAITNQEYKAILCARGGYGCVHLLPRINTASIIQNPKWLIGFSDVSALHALWQKAGVASIHGPMAKHLATLPSDDPCSEALIYLLFNGNKMQYSVAGSPYNRNGVAVGRLIGGNLAVLNGLAGTPYDLFKKAMEEDVILFIEDISEAIYAVERMLIRLYLSGSLHKLKGLIIGQFTEYKPDRNHASIEEMADRLLARFGINDIPVAFSFPVGHTDANYPLIEGAEVCLEVTDNDVKLFSIN